MFNRAFAQLSARIQSRLVRDEEGATAVEYGLIVGLIAVAIIAAMLVFAPAIQGIFEDIAGGLNGVDVVGGD
ncbi:Flp family type IVb pilin [Pseudolysinimonas sp.]